MDGALESTQIAGANQLTARCGPSAPQLSRDYTPRRSLAAKRLISAAAFAPAGKEDRMTDQNEAGGARVAVITGGASGIGAGVARRLHHDGVRVAIVDRDGDGAQRLAAELSGGALALTADVTVEAEVDAYMEATLSAFGHVDHVVLNAGIGSPTPLIEETLEGFDRLIAVNLRSVFLGIRAALRCMRGQIGGSVVVTCSTAGLGGSDLAVYSAAKHGCVAFVKSAALEGAAFGVRVNGIAPGSIDTRLMRQMEDHLGGGDSAREMLWATTPLGRYQERYGTAAEVAALVAFLLDEQSSWITGTVVPVDGGVLAMDPYRLPTRVTA
jgi:NAD(P)-dependent dehydrogenase (short-subunit alcohol dehydrogenase family)